MSSLYHAIIWIDHHEARIFHFGRSEAERLVLHPDKPTRHIHHKANSIGSGHAAEDQDFLHRVAQSIADAGAVLIAGPANAKTELVKHIHHHDPQLMKLIVAGAGLALLETVSAKMRIFRAPEFLATAFLLAVLGMLIHFLLES
jgi:stalled ribosome rescue protein Dom34